MSLDNKLSISCEQLYDAIQICGPHGQIIVWHKQLPLGIFDK